MRRYTGEAIGTFGLVFAGCGALAIAREPLGLVGVAAAFGLALAAMTVALAPVSGAHFNPAVSLAMTLLGKLPRRDLLPYVAAQLAGATAAAGVLFAIARGRPGATPLFAAEMVTGYGKLSPGSYGLGSAIVCEVALTALFVFVTLGVVRAAPMAKAAGAGLGYALIHLVGIPVTGMAANPARAFGPALLVGGTALEQVWVFLAAPLLGAALAALAHRWLYAVEGRGIASTRQDASPRLDGGIR